MYSALDLSRYIVSKCISDGHPITNLQLQKILYFIQRDYLEHGKKAFYDGIEAWKFGPVVPAVYYHYCGFGAMPISNSFKTAPIDNRDKACIDPIIESKRVLKPWDLVGDTHKSNGAWAQTFQKGAGNHEIIPTELIKAVG